MEVNFNQRVLDAILPILMGAIIAVTVIVGAIAISSALMTGWPQ